MNLLKVMAPVKRVGGERNNNAVAAEFKDSDCKLIDRENIIRGIMSIRGMDM